MVAVPMGNHDGVEDRDIPFVCVCVLDTRCDIVDALQKIINYIGSKALGGSRGGGEDRQADRSAASSPKNGDCH